ncbi:MAG: chitobiase/beta-hexosaminidase C-terminal domain-containing protein [Prevotella sp.]|nr:chitobiase/beta-hexosaminidase C-terminal domain-containing protein [Prevotella sp.]
MKKIFIIFAVLALCLQATQAKLVSTEVWRDSLLNSHVGLSPKEANLNVCNFREIVNSTYDPDGADCFLHIQPDKDDFGQMLRAWIFTSLPNFNYFRADFGHDADKLGNNWKLSFNYMFKLDAWGTAFPKQISVIGDKADADLCDVQTSGCFFSINRESESFDDGIATYNLQIGSTICEDKFRGSVESSYWTVELECADANTDHATVHVTIWEIFFNADGSDAEKTKKAELSGTVDATKIGKLRGIHSYMESDGYDEGGMNVLCLDRFCLSSLKEVDDTPCSAPVAEITGAYDKGRYVTLTCPTEGAKIYYSENQLEPGEEGWTEYTGEFLTEAKRIYAYAYSSVNETSSDVVLFGTSAGTKLRLVSLPIVQKVAYDEEKGYAFTVLPDYTYVDVIPKSVNFVCSVDGQTYTMQEGDTAYVAAGSTLQVRMEADGYTPSGYATVSTNVRPQAPLLWSQDFAGLVNASIYGTDKKNINLGSGTAFSVGVNNVHNINGFVSGGQNVGISVDSRIGLTEADYYTLQSGNGIVSAAPENTGSTEEEEEAVDVTGSGLGINGVAPGQYVFVTTTGGETNILIGCSKLDDVSTLSEQIYLATDDNMLIEVPAGVSVKSIEVRSNYERVTTNAYGWATHVSTNPLYFDELEDAKAYVVTNETNGGMFDLQKMVEVPARTPFIFHGAANTTYEVTIGTATQLAADDNLLKYSAENYDPTTWENPVYVINLANEENTPVFEATTETISAGTLYIESGFKAAEYLDVTIGTSGYKGLVYDKPLDFRGIEGLEVITVTGETVRSESQTSDFSEWNVDEIPAGEAVILKGEPGTYHILVGTMTDPLQYVNKLSGSTTDAYVTASKDNAVYVFNESNGKLELVDKSVVTEIPAGTIYLVSRYRGFVDLTLDEWGKLAMVSETPLDFTECSLNAYVVTGETESAVVTAPVSKVPANTPFFVLGGGEANTSYRVIMAGDDVTLGVSNLLTSSTENYPVINNDNYIYAYNHANGRIERMAEDYVVPAGEPFYVSEYARKIDRGYEDIVIPSNGVRSYVTEHPLDFEVAGLQAYIATREENGTVYTEIVKQVPAGMAVVLRGTAGEYSVPVIESAPSLSRNKLLGSRDADFVVNSQDNAVYAPVETSQYVEFYRVSPDSTIKAGNVYLITDRIGVERITLGNKGYVSYYSYNALDFSEIEGIEVKVVISETPYEINTKVVSQIPKDCAVFIKGEPGRTYNVPVGSLKELGCPNLLRSSHTDAYSVSTAGDNYVYALTGSGAIRQAPSSTVLKANVAYLKSKYGGFETVRTGENGWASWVTEKGLEFDYVEGFDAYVITDETVTEYFPAKVHCVPAGEAFYFHGEPNTEYQIPIYPEAPKVADNILVGSLTDELHVSDEAPNYVYGLKSNGKFAKADSEEVIDARRAYFVSKYGDFESIPIKNEYSTWVTEHPLDFTELHLRGLYAYIITDETETSFKNKWVTTVPANTPIFLRSEHVDTVYNVPICKADDVSFPDENLLQGSLTDSYTVPESSVVYGLTVSGKWRKAPVGHVFSARQAYILSKYVNSAAAKSIVLDDMEDIDDETTSVDNIDAVEDKKGHRYYNLAGQSVDDDYKGIVIDKTGQKKLRE